MTFQMNPEFDRQGWAVCLFWLQGSKHDGVSTDRKTSNPEPDLKRRKWEPVGPLSYGKIND